MHQVMLKYLISTTYLNLSWHISKNISTKCTYCNITLLKVHISTQHFKITDLSKHWSEEKHSQPVFQLNISNQQNTSFCLFDLILKNDYKL